MSLLLLLSACCATVIACWRADSEGQRRSFFDILAEQFRVYFEKVWIASFKDVFLEALLDPKLFDGIETSGCKPHWTFINHRLWRITTGEPVANVPWIDLHDDNGSGLATSIPPSCWFIGKPSRYLGLDISA